MNVSVAPLTNEQKRDRHGVVARLVTTLWRKLGVALREIARLLDVAESTLRSWIGRDPDRVRAPGRPLRRRADRTTRNDIFEALRAASGRLSVRELKRAYPHVSRHEIEALSNRYRRVTRKRHRRGLACLEWTTPGTVRAMDFTQIPGGVEDLGDRVLVVRDLSSGMTLCAEPCASEGADDVRRVIGSLIDALGAPLVVKSDNGSGFVASTTRQLLDGREALPLYSPPATPAYNGACEAGVGSVKHRAHALAATHGGHVTLDDLHAARAQANVQPTRRSATTILRRDAWHQREPIADALRQELQRRVDHWRRRCRTDQGIALDRELPHAEQASIDRFAIGRALRELRLLLVLGR